jgi:hypothetical protein
MGRPPEEWDREIISESVQFGTKANASFVKKNSNLE